MRVYRLVVASLLFASAWGVVYSVWFSWQFGQKLELWQTSRQADFPIDLSKPGTGSGTLNQLTDFVCHQIYLVQIDNQSIAKREMLDGFRGELVIVDSKKKEVMTIPLHYELYESWFKLEDSQLMLTRNRPFEAGEYTLRLEVRNPAQALAGIPHRLVVRYQLCGLEGMPQLVGYGIVIVCGIAMLVFAWLLRRTYYHSLDVTNDEVLLLKS
jgi:hypothetical protein